MTLNDLLDTLACWADDSAGDMCYVQITSDGRFYLGLGLHDSESMNLEQFTKWCEDQL